MTDAARYARIKADPLQLEAAKERHRQYRERNREKLRERGRANALRYYYQDHERSKARNRANQLLWAARNGDKLKERGPKYRKKWYDKFKKDHAKVVARRKDACTRWRALKAFLDSYKISCGCIDCGYDKHPAALHFDHVRGEKKFVICKAKSIIAASEEIEKCDVRCANCHSIRHAVARSHRVVT